MSHRPMEKVASSHVVWPEKMGDLLNIDSGTNLIELWDQNGTSLIEKRSVVNFYQLNNFCTS
jgi:hypothetical protein